MLDCSVARGFGTEALTRIPQIEKAGRFGSF